MSIPYLRLKKGEDRRIRGGHPWIYSNEIDTNSTPLKTFKAGEEVTVIAADKSLIGTAYINPHSLIAARIISRKPDVTLDTAFFVQQFKQALALRQRLFSAPYYRLIFSEGDGLPGLVIDRFANDFVVQVNTAGMENKIADIVQALLTVVTDTHSILLRNDSKIRLQEGLELYTKAAFGQPPQEITLEENGVKFLAPLWKGQKTSWFYDHRLNRARLQSYVADKTVLDVFSYLGSFGIQAACFGAKQVDCIESSAFACDYINKNAALNGVSEKVKTHCADAFDSLKALSQENKTFDVIILDPPAFVKKLKDRKEGLVAYQRLNEMALKLLSPDGILISCSCSMHVSMEDLTAILQRASYRTQIQVQVLERGHQGPDHPLHLLVPETDYLKSLLVKKLG